jgi:hypothetical protein
LLIGESAVVGGIDAVVDGSVRICEGLIIGDCSVSVIEVDNVIYSSTVVCRDITRDSTIVRIDNIICVIHRSITTVI